jgi:hypothetical protein
MTLSKSNMSRWAASARFNGGLNAQHKVLASAGKPEERGRVSYAHAWNYSVDNRREMSLRQAQHCRRMADFCKDIDLRADWLELAERWLKMIRSQSNAVQGQSEPVAHDGGEDRRRA